ncbi:hypothetical protein [Halorarum salinum]|uniref:Uncharacterized protein n=1 Tax=Halorarum salinum TaxID=2743089 RepID=A0A7D5Q9Y0_9EURY|nr:hypothetical protein [Halobaculum salinum]QLG61997.1 hypothetical protein HUG12_09790 [Halobaculum salinum]
MSATIKAKNVSPLLSTSVVPKIRNRKRRVSIVDEDRKLIARTANRLCDEYEIRGGMAIGRHIALSEFVERVFDAREDVLNDRDKPEYVQKESDSPE